MNHQDSLLESLQSSLAATANKPTDAQVRMLFGMSNEIKPYMSEEDRQKLETFLSAVNDGKKTKADVSFRISTLVKKRETIELGIKNKTIQKITVVKSDYGISTKEADALLNRAQFLLTEDEYKKITDGRADDALSFLEFLEDINTRTVDSEDKKYESYESFDQLIADINWKTHGKETHKARMMASECYSVFLSLRRMVEVAELRQIETNPEMTGYHSTDDERDLSQLEDERANVPRYIENYNEVGMAKPHMHADVLRILNLQERIEKLESEKTEGLWNTKNLLKKKHQINRMWTQFHTLREEIELETGEDLMERIKLSLEYKEAEEFASEIGFWGHCDSVGVGGIVKAAKRCVNGFKDWAHEIDRANFISNQLAELH